MKGEFCMKQYNNYEIRKFYWMCLKPNRDKYIIELTILHNEIYDTKCDIISEDRIIWFSGELMKEIVLRFCEEYNSVA
jgi:hypothetical protein